MKIPTAQAHHEEHLNWIKELKFYEDELQIFERRLAEVMGNKSNKEMFPGVEQFQNQFVRQKEVLDELKHEINIHEQNLSELLKNGDTDSWGGTVQHKQIADRMETFKRLFKEMKDEFYPFLTGK
ncbi:MAG: hypothetical protein RJA52_610 [Bacteroidota bacterium]|jgi:hypothetical protein